ncbi:MAG: RrF2 family transcriptional regulator [Mogibacterium sp.]|nr:RrF2 family transcriptional regulator [Mogibacterium sp.]
MMVSTKGRYALTVLVDLARNSGEGYVSLADIAEREHLSMKYLESIISMLNKGGMLESLRGKNGGYRLAREPKDYNISEILVLTEGTLAPVNCIISPGVQCEKAATCSTLPLWAGLDKVIENYLSSITLEDILTGNRRKMLGDYCDSCDTQQEEN